MRTIKLTDDRDRAFAQIAQKALVNLTLLPSGLCTPAEDYLIIGEELVHIDDVPPEENPHREPRPRRTSFTWSY